MQRLALASTVVIVALGLTAMVFTLVYNPFGSGGPVAGVAQPPQAQAVSPALSGPAQGGSLLNGAPPAASGTTTHHHDRFDDSGGRDD